MCCYVLLCVVMCCYVLLCVAMCCYVLLCVAMCCYVLLCVAMCCYVLLCVVMCCYVLLCIVMYCYVLLCIVILYYHVCLWDIYSNVVLEPSTLQSDSNSWLSLTNVSDKWSLHAILVLNTIKTKIPSPNPECHSLATVLACIVMPVLSCPYLPA